jgi:hypothetical protein
MKNDTNDRNFRKYGNYGNFSERVELKPVLTTLANVTSLTAHERDLADLLTISRAAGGPGENYLIGRICALAKNVNADLVVDDYGNIFVTILNPDGGVPTLMWTAHTDSVASRGEPYNSELGVYERDGPHILGLLTPNNGTSCLGADCGTGIWLMMSMIDAKKPGRYAFFRDEETGCQGSKWAAEYTPERFKGVIHAIAFDRAGTTDIITSQHGSRCASEAFATSLSQILCVASGGKIDLHSAVGVYTDTAELVSLVPECSNISVGYNRQHTASETQDLTFAVMLRDALLAADFSTLVCDMTPASPRNKKKDWGWEGDWETGYDTDTYTTYPVTAADEEECAEYLRDLILKNVAEFCEFACWKGAPKIQWRDAAGKEAGKEQVLSDYLEFCLLETGSSEDLLLDFEDYIGDTMEKRK